VAFAAALIWTLHPLNTEAAHTSLSDRVDDAFFYLLTLYASREGPLAGCGSPCCRACGDGVQGVDGDGPASWWCCSIACSSRFVSEACENDGVCMAVSVDLLVLAAVTSMGPRPRLSSVPGCVGPWTYLLNQPPIPCANLRLTVCHKLVLL